MKRADYMRLAKESLASRKKNTRSTVRGIAFGLIFLIPVLFLALGVYVELTANVNKSPELLGLQLTGATRSSLTPQAYTETRNDGSYEYEPMIITTENLDATAKAVTGEIYHYEQIKSETSYMNVLSSSDAGAGGYAFQFAVGSEAKSYSYSYTGSLAGQVSNNFAAIIDVEKSGMTGKFNPQKIADRYDGSIYVSGYDKGYTGDGKGQVIVSELLLEKLGLTAADTYGKKISLQYTDGASNDWSGAIYIDDNSDTGDNDDYSTAQNLSGVTRDVLLFYDYEVVGVVKKTISEDAQKAASSSPIYSLLANATFFTTASRDYAPGKALEPEINSYSEETENYKQNWYVATYPDSFDIDNMEYIGLGANNFTSVEKVIVRQTQKESTVVCAPQETLLVDAESYAKLDKIVSQTAAALSSILGDDPRGTVIRYTSSVFEMMNMMYTIFSYVILVLSIFGGIVFFAAMVNLFNSIAHSVDSRKHYLGVMRAIGARGSTISKLYLAESLTIFRRATIWIILFAGGICVGLWFLINYLFGFASEMMVAVFGVKFSISIIYIPIAIVACLAALVVIGIVFSYTLSRRISKRPITEILVD